jgi:hypothetical protein
VPVTILAECAFCPPAIALQTNAMTWALVFTGLSFFLLVLFLVLLLLSVTQWCPFFYGRFPPNRLKVLRMRLNFSESL